MKKSYFNNNSYVITDSDFYHSLWTSVFYTNKNTYIREFSEFISLTEYLHINHTRIHLLPYN